MRKIDLNKLIKDESEKNYIKSGYLKNRDLSNWLNAEIKIINKLYFKLFLDDIKQHLITSILLLFSCFFFSHIIKIKSNYIFELLCIFVFFNLYIIARCDESYKLYERILFYFLNSFIINTIIYCLFFNLPIINVVFQNFYLLFLNTNQNIKSIPEILLFAHYIFNFIIVGYFIIGRKKDLNKERFERIVKDYDIFSFDK